VVAMPQWRKMKVAVTRTEALGRPSSNVYKELSKLRLLTPARHYGHFLTLDFTSSCVRPASHPNTPGTWTYSLRHTRPTTCQ